MDELGLDPASIAGWFTKSHDGPPLLMVVPDGVTPGWVAILREAVRRAYISDAKILEHAKAHGVSDLEIIATKLPDPGAVMAGDFGEILAYIFHATVSLPARVAGPKKWRLKQDRLKAAPHSDVVQFYLPHWPTASTEDAVLCSEVKTKSTNGQSIPIAEAIEGSLKDRTSRLAKTFAWLRERGLNEEPGSIAIDQVNRFLKAAEFPSASRHFFAVAVVCSSLAAGELAAASAQIPAGITVVVLVVPNLKATYSAVFQAIKVTSLGGGT